MKHSKTMTALFAAGLMAAAAPAFADNDERYYQQNSGSFISHERAGQIALWAVKGSRVQEVDFEHNRRGDYFEVEVFGNDNREYDVIVDAKTGKVLSSRQDW